MIRVNQFLNFVEAWQLIVNDICFKQYNSEFNQLRNLAKEAIQRQEQDRDFIQKGRLYFEDMKKDLERPEDQL
jgi:hypothetical protein